MGKPNKPRIVSSSNEGDDIRTIVIEAMTNQQVINAIAEKVAEAIAEKFEQRLSLCEQDLRIKGTQMKEIETKMARMEVYVDQLEQYSRRTSVRISGVQESELGEDLTTVVTDILANSMPDMPRLTMGDVNRAHRVGQRKRQDQHTQRSQHPRQILVQFKDYNGKLNITRSRKRIRETMPHVYIHEDLTQSRATLLYKARQAKREHNIVDCWSFDGRIVIKDANNKIHTIKDENELMAHSTLATRAGD